MNLSKIIFSGVFSISIIGLGTASHANDTCRNGVMLDKVWINGKEDCIQADNGWGNGDDAAPGGSAGNNNAENFASDSDNTNPNGFIGGAAPGNSNSNGNQDVPD